jgi:hypothetical protein
MPRDERIDVRRLDARRQQHGRSRRHCGCHETRSQDCPRTARMPHRHPHFIPTWRGRAVPKTSRRDATRNTAIAPCRHGRALGRRRFDSETLRCTCRNTAWRGSCRWDRGIRRRERNQTIGSSVASRALKRS